MIINWLGDFFLTVTPRRLTRSGSTGSARLTRFCTSTCAMFRSMPGLKVTVSVYEPSLPQVEDMYIMSSTPLTCCSMGAATVSATVVALAPGYTAYTSMVGGVMSGYCDTGREKSPTSPASVMMMDITEAKIGRSMKKRVNIFSSCQWTVGGVQTQTGVF